MADRNAQTRRNQEGRQSASPGRPARHRGAGAKPPGDDALFSDSFRDADDGGHQAGRRDDLVSELRAVQELDRDHLAARWRQIFHRDPPPRVSRELMVRAICYSVQVEAQGGLDRQTQRRLAQFVAEMQSCKTPTEMPTRIKPGTRLIREWHGEIHEALVLEEGFAFRGRVHRSLSAIAREITGTSWNGHAFFGLRRRGRRMASTHDASGGAQATQRARVVSEPGDG